jgi:hypothetical protein
MSRKEPKDKGTIELFANTFKDGVLAGIKLEFGVIMAVATLGNQTGTFESGWEKVKDSTKGCHEIGQRIGKKIAKVS